MGHASTFERSKQGVGEGRPADSARVRMAIAGAALLAVIAALAIAEAPALIGFVVAAAGATGWCLWLDRQR